MQVCTETHQRQNKEGGEAVDILLDSNGDLAFKGTDIVLANSVRQKIKIRLKWFFQEWRWDDEAGVPYFEYLFVKNPDIDQIKELVERSEERRVGKECRSRWSPYH